MTEENILLKKKKWYTRKWPYFVVIIILAAGGVVYGKFFKPAPAPKYETVKVVRADINQTVDATGNVEATNEVDLKFLTSGRLATLDKKVGDSVKAGDVLATLELSDLNALVAQADAGVKKAQADLDKILAGNTKEYVASLDASLNQAKATLDQAKVTADNSVHAAESALETAKNNLKLAEGGENSQIVQDAYEDTVSLLQGINNVLSTALNSADGVLGIDNVLANDDFEKVLSALDTSKKNAANSAYYIAKAAKESFAQYNTLVASSSHAQIDTASDSAEDALLKMNNLLVAVSDTLDKTIAIGDLSQTELDALKSGIATQRTNVTNKYTSLLTQKQAVKTAKNSYDSYSITYNKAVKDLEDAQKKSVADVAVYQAAVDKAQAMLEDAKKPARAVDTASYHALVASANASLAQAIANRDKAILKVPADGVVGKIGPKIGEYVSINDTVIKLVSDHFDIKVDIPETDIGKIKIGTGAMVTFDAFGSDLEYHGSVVSIEKGETVIQDVIYYNVRVALDESNYVNRKDEMNRILNGMTANVVFSTDGKGGVLVIPQRAVRTNGEKKVRILENGQVKEVRVALGIKGDGGMVEVELGLKEGDEVVVSEIKK